MLAFRVQSNFRVTLVLVPGTPGNEYHKQVLVLLEVPFVARNADDVSLPCPMLVWELTASPPSPGSGVWFPPGFTTLTLCATTGDRSLLTAASLGTMNSEKTRPREKVRSSERMTDTS